jgi:hypothetical protein
MAYKIDSDKGVRILRTLMPPVVFVNGMVDTTSFTVKLKAEGFSVFPIKSVEAAQKFLARKRTNPVVLEGWIESTDVINQIFGDVLYSYVWIYPNNPKELWKRMGSNKDDAQKVKDIVNKNQKIYNEHLSVYEERILTILI